MKRIFIWGIPLLFCLSSCTISVVTTHTQGEASDVIDENQQATATPTVTVPISPIPSVISK